jgi:hypothetical protein
MSNQEVPTEEIIQALQTVYARLVTLNSMNAANILIPGGPQARYHALIEEAYAALGKIENEIDALRAELEYQHQRLDEAREAALAETTHEQE